MEILWSILLGLLQGVAEFLPISSSGHLAFVAHFFNVPLASELFFTVAVHFGSIFALTFFFRAEIVDLFKSNLRWLIFLLMATFVTGLLGLLFHSVIANSFTNPKLMGIGWWVTGAILIVAQVKLNRPNQEKPFRWYHAILVGLAQAASLFPGVSRSGTTLTASLLCGLGINPAFRFAFLLAIPTILMACLGELWYSKASFSQIDSWVPYGVGFAVSAISSYGALKLLQWFLTRRQFLPFIIYSLVLGTFAFFFL